MEQAGSAAVAAPFDAGHAPGPWSFRGVRDASHRCVEAGPNLIASDIPSEADARLIAAAPDLKRELLKLRNEVDGLIANFDDELRDVLGDASLDVLTERLTAASAALAKATQPSAPAGEANTTSESGA